MLFKKFKNTHANTTHQELVNDGLWSKSGLSSVYVNKIFLGIQPHLFIYTLFIAAFYCHQRRAE